MLVVCKTQRGINVGRHVLVDLLLRLQVGRCSVRAWGVQMRGCRLGQRKDCVGAVRWWACCCGCRWVQERSRLAWLSSTRARVRCKGAEDEKCCLATVEPHTDLVGQSAGERVVG